MKKLLALSLFTVFLSMLISCKKDKPIDPDPSVVGNNGVFITNEGNFQFGNAKVSYFDKDSSKVIEDLYQPKNNVTLGDICQSMYLFDSKAYIVLNNSGKIEVVNAKTFEHITSITGLTSPRYFLPVSSNKAYVTDLFSNTISIINLSTNTVSGTISCKGWTEEMLFKNDKVYVTNESSDKVYVINSQTDVLEDSIKVGYASNSIREDKNGKLWVMCGTNYVDIKASLYCIDPTTNKVIKSFEFADITHAPYKLRINGTKDKLYFLDQSIYKMDISDGALPVVPFINASTHSFYGLGVDPKTNIIYVSDAVDFVQRGIIFRYDADGTLIDNFLAGINPGEFVFQ